MPRIVIHDGQDEVLVMRATRFIGTEGLGLALFEGITDDGARYVFAGDVSACGDLIEDVWEGEMPIVAVHPHLIIQSGGGVL